MSSLVDLFYRYHPLPFQPTSHGAWHKKVGGGGCSCKRMPCTVRYAGEGGYLLCQERRGGILRYRLRPSGWGGDRSLFFECNRRGAAAALTTIQCHQRCGQTQPDVSAVKCEQYTIRATFLVTTYRLCLEVTAQKQRELSFLVRKKNISFF
ncbi:unnamed protein product, partial [Ectocarpus sp. 12 AP-2014]